MALTQTDFLQESATFSISRLGRRFADELATQLERAMPQDAPTPEPDVAFADVPTTAKEHRLMAMGFELAVVRAALEHASGDLQGAVAFIVERW